MTGCFVAFEGLDGAGKTTQVRAVAEEFSRAGVAVTTTREPGGTRLGERLRAILLEDEPISPDAELLLLFAARSEHIAALVRPALASGAFVLCDRFTDSTYAYQGGGRGISRKRIATLESWVQGEVRPDLTIFLDISVEEGLARTSGPLFREMPDRFEREHLPFFQRVRQAYLERCRLDPQRYLRVDAALDAREITHTIVNALYSRRGS